MHHTNKERCDIYVIFIISILIFVWLLNGSTFAYEKSTRSEIAIIGAGLAGLTAAYRLQQKGYKVNVYEARSRVGGRVHTVLLKNYSGNYSVAELGAQNISDGGDACYCLSLAKELGLTIVEDEKEFTSLFFDGYHYYDRIALMDEQKSRLQEIERKLDEKQAKYNNMQEVINAIFSKDSILHKIFTFQMTSYEGTEPAKLGIYHNIEILQLMILGRLISENYTSSYSPTLHFIRIEGGNAKLPLKLAEKTLGNLHLKAVLREVRLDPTNKIMLIFQDGRVVLCDKLILAIPCSVYKDIIFDQKIIPNDRLLTIKKVQYGTNGKILVPVKYPQLTHNVVFNDKMTAFFNDDRQLLNLFFFGDHATNLQRKFSSLFYEAITMIKGAIKGVQLPMDLPIFPEEKHFVKYSKPVVKSWSEDPYARGSYANFGIDSPLIRENDYKGVRVKSIFEPINDRIYFIGEHATVLDVTGTMEGAVESGERISQLF